MLKEATQKNTYHTVWLCLCECGRTYEARGALLVDDTTTQCKACAAEEAVATRQGRLPDKEFALQVYSLATKSYIARRE